MHTQPSVVIIQNYKIYLFLENEKKKPISNMKHEINLNT